MCQSLLRCNGPGAPSSVGLAVPRPCAPRGLFPLASSCSRCETSASAICPARLRPFDGSDTRAWNSPASTVGVRAEVRRLLRETALIPCGSHTPLDQLTGHHFAETVAFNREIGNRILIVPGLPDEYHSLDSWGRAAALFNDLADRLRPSGMRIGYHNHAV